MAGSLLPDLVDEFEEITVFPGDGKGFVHPSSGHHRPSSRSSGASRRVGPTDRPPAQATARRTLTSVTTSDYLMKNQQSSPTGSR